MGDHYEQVLAVGQFDIDEHRRQKSSTGDGLTWRRCLKPSTAGPYTGSAWMKSTDT